MVTNHFQLHEFFIHCSKSEQMVALTSVDTMSNLFALHALLEYVRSYYGKPIRITSGFRDWSHNFKVGGSSTSQHMEGQAADIASEDIEDFSTLERTVRHLHFTNPDIFGQVIIYPKKHIIHVSTPTQQIHGELFESE